MKYIVSDAATLSFADGSKFTLEQGIHDSKTFSESVKSHWAFASYAKPIDESELVSEALAEDLTLRVTKLEGEVTSLMEQLADRDKTITGLEGEVTSLKAELAAAEGAKNAKKQQSAE